ncbi:MAG: DNA-directed RNA polymerase subunit G [Thermosphaera sp.]
MSMELKCVVEGVEDLRMPKVFRVHASCGDAKLDVEFHNEVVPKAVVAKDMLVEITREKEKCLQHYFCGQGYVVSTGKIGEHVRTIISLHGFLIVLKTPSPPGLNTMDQVFVGVDFKQ